MREDKVEPSCAATARQCEIEYEEISQMTYDLYREREDRADVEASYKREIESLERYAQVMKDTADKFLSELREKRQKLLEREQALTPTKEERLELERQVYRVQDSLDRANQAVTNIRDFYTHEVVFRKEVCAIKPPISSTCSTTAQCSHASQTYDFACMPTMRGTTGELERRVESGRTGLPMSGLELLPR